MYRTWPSLNGGSLKSKMRVVPVKNKLVLNAVKFFQILYFLDGSEEGQDIFVGGALDKGVGY